MSRYCTKTDTDRSDYLTSTSSLRSVLAEIGLVIEILLVCQKSHFSCKITHNVVTKCLSHCSAAVVKRWTLERIHHLGYSERAKLFFKAIKLCWWWHLRSQCQCVTFFSQKFYMKFILTHVDVFDVWYKYFCDFFFRTLLYFVIFCKLDVNCCFFMLQCRAMLFCVTA